ncbi:PD-(D/E)XK nuclease family protein [Cyanobacteria bacterium FACHB-471]|nr:PD-(D/E)XK nuclease family protein [Cyanobacteria bacterium FACHB-471]
MPSSQDKRAILERFIVNNKDLENLESKISRFNLFEAIGMVRQEIKHSNFIKFLLDPSEKHRLGDLFLKKLLVSVLGNSEDIPLDSLEVSVSNFSDAEVRREWRNIDLLIYSPSNHFVCTIENKVDSSEGLNQLITYEEVVEKEFSDCKKVFIYLTKEGFTASNTRWLSLSYVTVADLIESVCNERRSILSEDIHVSMRHYVDLIRRHLMSESDIAELCRKIYKQHRQAIELIYEHRPDLRVEIAEFIEELIKKCAQQEHLEKDDSTQRWIRFAPKEWDDLKFQKTCCNWTSSQRILLFEFWNEPQNLQLRLVIGPGSAETKQAIYQRLQQPNIPGLRKTKLKEDSWSQACIMAILTPADYEDGNLEDLQEKIRLFWNKYMSGDMKLIRAAISSLQIL